MQAKDFEIFVKQIRQKLSARAMSVVADTDTAEDIVQDCLLKLWTMRERLDEYSSPEALAMTMVHHMAINSIRDKRPDSELRDDLIAGREPSPEDIVIAGERNRTIEAILSMLPDAQQAIIRMRHIEGLGNGEIARLIGSTDGAVRTALSRARNRIAEMFLELEQRQ